MDNLNLNLASHARGPAVAELVGRRESERSRIRSIANALYGA